MARAPLLVFLNDDSTVEGGCIDALVRAASDDPTIGAVGARIVSLDGTLEEAGSVIWRDGSCDHVGEGLPRGSDAYREPRDVDYASANGLLVSRRAWDLVGGFDERYFPAYFEDVDLCLSLAAHGLRTRYEPQARVIHRGSQSTSNTYREFLLTRNQRQAGREVGFGTRPLRAAAPDALRARVRRRSGAGLETRSWRGRTRRRRPQRPQRATARALRRRVDPSRAAAEVRDEYQAYLEQRVTDRDRRVDGARDLPLGTVGSPAASMGRGSPVQATELISLLLPATQARSQVASEPSFRPRSAMIWRSGRVTCQLVELRIWSYASVETLQLGTQALDLRACDHHLARHFDRPRPLVAHGHDEAVPLAGEDGELLSITQHGGRPWRLGTRGRRGQRSVGSFHGFEVLDQAALLAEEDLRFVGTVLTKQLGGNARSRTSRIPLGDVGSELRKVFQPTDEFAHLAHGILDDRLVPKDERVDADEARQCRAVVALPQRDAVGQVHAVPRLE